MADNNKKQDAAVGKDELSIEEFSILELEDRLEFLQRSDLNCGCPAQP